MRYLRSWLGLPLIAKGRFGRFPGPGTFPSGFHIRRHPGTYSQAYANQVAIAIHNAQLYKQAGDNAALEERNRLARELHDSVAQALYSISLFVDATRMALKTNRPQVVESHLEELTLLSREAMSDMRLMIFELRPPILEQVGLIAALQCRLDPSKPGQAFRQAFTRKGRSVSLPQQESELYRIVQEALNNVIKHAQAHQVAVRVIAEERHVRIIIEDDGVGFDLRSPKTEADRASGICVSGRPRLGASCKFESIQARGQKLRLN